MQLKWRLSHAQGYLELGMVSEAAEELSQIPAEEAGRTEVLALRGVLLQEQKNWPVLETVARELASRQPDNAGWWIMWAYATRRAQSLTDAEKILREAETHHPREATIQFNLGCYACQQGELAEASRRVKRAISLDKAFKSAAETDPDLAPLREAKQGK